MAKGATTIDFGAAPGGNLASVAVAGQAAILSTSYVEAFLMYEATADALADEQLIAPINLRCGTPVDGVGFTIYAASEWVLTGTYAVRWVWV
jgi:hypothetical protein